MKIENKQNIRKCDSVGRVMIPYKLRKKLDIRKKDPLEMKIIDETLIITKV